MSAFRRGATMADAIALSSPSGRMSKRARKAANAVLGDALFGPESGFGGWEHTPSTEETRAGRIAQLERQIDDWKRVYARQLNSGRSSKVSRAYAVAVAELAALRS